MEKTLIIIFWMDNGKTMNISITHPRNDLPQNTAMVERLKRNFILSENGAGQMQSNTCT